MKINEKIKRKQERDHGQENTAFTGPDFNVICRSPGRGTGRGISDMRERDREGAVSCMTGRTGTAWTWCIWRLKECYPRQEGLYRNEDGRICVRAAWEEEPPAGAKGNGEERGWAAEEQPDDEEIRQMFQAVMERFGKAKDRFVDAYRTQVELSKRQGCPTGSSMPFRSIMATTPCIRSWITRRGRITGRSGRRRSGK